MRNHIPVMLSTLLLIATSCRSGQQDAAGGATTDAAGATTVPRGATTAADTMQGVVSTNVSVTLDRTTYTAGATATMTVRNQSRDTLGYNQCSSRAVERQDGTAWTAVSEPERMCTMELRLLNPGEMQTATTDLPPTLAPGRYRLVLTLARQSTSGGNVRAVSLPFRVN